MSKPSGRPKSSKSSKELSHAALRQAIVRRLAHCVHGKGRLVFAAAPALTESYTELLRTTFAQLGRVFTAPEVEKLRGVLREKLTEAFNASPYHRIIVEYEAEADHTMALNYVVKIEPSTIEQQYENWVKTRKPPLFGTEADAKVMALAHALGSPSDVPVLDVGAGTGRNTIPLARAGFPTDAIELAPALANILKRDAEKEALAIRVYQGDALSEHYQPPADHYRLVVLAEVIASHIRSTAQCRALFHSAATALKPDGLLAFNAFLAVDEYKPDYLARELSQVFWCNLFTRPEIAQAMSGLPFELVSDESVYAFERDHLPKEAWPPTGWFEGWTRGGDLFDLPPDRSPFELRWLVYRRV